MTDLKVLRSYAFALLQIAKEKNEVEIVNNNLSFLSGLFKDNNQLISFLSSPMITKKEKEKLIEKQIKNNICETTYAFLLILIKKHKIGEIEAVIKQFNHVYNMDKGILEGRIYTSYPIDEDKIQAIENIFSKKYCKDVHLEVKIDSNVIAGMKIYIDDTLYDYSIDSKLNQVKNNLLLNK